MPETEYSIPIHLLSSEQLEIYYNQCNTVDSPFYDFDLMAAIQTELKQRKATEQLTAKTPRKSFRWGIATYLLMSIIAIICGLQLRAIFQFIKCPAPIAGEIIND